MSEVSGPLPPFARIYEFLSESEHQQLLDWTLSIRDSFRPATVSKRQPRVDPERRIALTTANLGPVEGMLRERFLAALPRLKASTGSGGPPPTSLEIEIAAHGDGAYYRPHIDMPVGISRKREDARIREDRILSAVYYFYAEPKGFSGGQLRLYRFGRTPIAQDPQPELHVDLEPVRNSLVAFPSWVPHEVLSIACPSREFGDYRFAINCWYCRAITPSA